MRFTAIHLENWTNFRAVDLELRQRVLVVGPNASGKSNFLDVFRFLRDIVERGLKLAVNEVRPGFSALRSLHARAYSDVVIDVRMGNDGASWRYELTLNQDKQRRIYVRRERVWSNDHVVLDRKDDPALDPVERGQTHLEQSIANSRFRPVADFFRQVRYLHVVPQLVREPDRATAFRGHPFGAELLEQVAHLKRLNFKAYKSRLRLINKALKVAVPQFSELELGADDRGNPHLKARYEHWRPQGGWQSERQFSDGTLRLFGLMWALLDGNGPLLLEEPELSLHPALVRAIPGLLWRLTRKSGRQVFLSTHSTELLSDEGLEPGEVVLLVPRKNGSTATSAASIHEIKQLLDAGLSLGEAVLPRVAPKNASQLGFFFDEDALGSS
jgi:predicted ATPase